MNKLRLYIILIFAIFFSAAYLANKSNKISHKNTPVFVEMYTPIWEEAKKQVIEIAQAMPEEKYRFKPSD
ncbi:MAG: hypothetical protein AAGI07_16945, partial [Bacteroidota bacterium]